MSVLFSLAVYLVVINVVTYLAFAADKRAARYKYWRVSERKLFMLMLFGGTPAGIYAAKRLRHKNRKKSFQSRVAVIIVLQVIVIAVLGVYLI